MRVFFLLLVVIKLSVWVWNRGYLGNRNVGREPERLTAQIQPERMQVQVGIVDTVVDQACARVGPLGTAEADVIGKELMVKNASVERVPLDESATFWVNIPAVNGKPAEAEIAELRKAGFREFFVVKDSGEYQNAISLGEFKSQEAARNKMLLLGRNNIRNARITVKGGNVGKVILNVRGPVAMLDKALAGTPHEATDCAKK